MEIKIPETIRLTNPLWTEKILKRTSFKSLLKPCVIKDTMLDINNFRCCIVGETLNLFDKDYCNFRDRNVGLTYGEINKKYHNGCSKCAKFSLSFQEIIENQALANNIGKQFEICLTLYATHLEKNHKRIIINARKKQQRNKDE